MPRAKYTKRKDGRYEAKVTIGVKEDGSRERMTLYATSSKELERKIADVKAKLSYGTLTKTSDMSFGDYAKQWDRTYNTAKSINTRVMYSNIVDKHIIPAIGHIPMDKLCRSDIQGIINDRLDKRRTCEQILLVLRQIIKSAVSDKLMQPNSYELCSGVAMPEKQKTNKRALTDLEKDALRKADFTPFEQAFVYVLYFFGLRREEALALMKSDFDWKRRTIQINKAIIFDVNNPMLKTTKSAYSIRTLHIPSGAYDTLHSYVQSLEGLYLFSDDAGKPITKMMYRRRWNSIIKKMNAVVTSDAEKKMKINKITGLTAHIFRHNFCTELYYSGVSIKAAVYIMGHKDSKLIMDVYSHLDSQREDITNKLDNSMVL